LFFIFYFAAVGCKKYVTAHEYYLKFAFSFSLIPLHTHTKKETFAMIGGAQNVTRNEKRAFGGI